MKAQTSLERLSRADDVVAGNESATHAQNVTDIARTCRALAHTLNNMLTVSRGNLMLLDAMLKDPDAAAVGEQVRHGLERADRLAGNLLFLAQSDGFRGQPVNLRSFFADNRVHLLHALPSSARVIDIDPRAGSIWTDPSYLAMALNAIVVNAREAVAPALLPVLRCEVRTGRRGSVTLAVSDNGGGIANDIRPFVFDAGFTTKSGGHAGIGLWFVRQLALASHGEVRVESAPELGGARIVLQFPALS